jgi:hypothetical protein
LGDYWERRPSCERQIHPTTTKNEQIILHLPDFDFHLPHHIRGVFNQHGQKTGIARQP